MDKRQQKTRESIFKAFSKLLETKNYNNITVQEIIDEANVGRSTFYAHFETKDDLLNIMCKKIFGHIFSTVLEAEEHHDFSHENKTLIDKLTHLLYHLKEQKKDVISVLTNESSDQFIKYFKFYLEKLFSKYEISSFHDIPKDFILNHYVSSFAEVVKWWIRHDMNISCEKVVEYYVTLNRIEENN